MPMEASVDMASKPSDGLVINDEKIRTMKEFPRSDDFAVLLGKLARSAVVS